jgi:serine phosphatase RsbU (regulator of sigma subunit)
MIQVAGDIYDFVALDDLRLAVLVADVSGHGVAAALVASMVKGAFRAQREVLNDPAMVLTRMNHILTGELESTFVTASCTLIDMEAKMLRSSGAGHPPALVRSGANRDYHELSRNGLVLGQFPDAHYESIEEPLGPGTRVILLTDGILEAANCDEDQFADGTMQKYLREDRSLSASDLADGLIASVSRWAGLRGGQTLDDDLTLIVIDIDP